MSEQFTRDLPTEFVSNIIELCGEKGEAWLTGIPGLIQYLQKKWAIKVGKHFRHLSINYVANATTEDGRSAVLKLASPLPDIEIYGEAEYLQTLDGNGVVRCLQFDQNNQALLIEKCVPGKNLRSVCRLAQDDAVSIAVDLLKTLLRPVPASHTNFIMLDNWFDGLRRAAGTNFPQGYAERALDFYKELSRDTGNTFLLHGDFHHENILSARRAPFLAIDPKGIIGHLAYDVGVFLNNHANWLEWDTRLEKRMDKAVQACGAAFELRELTIRKAAFCQMVLSWWWLYDEMPSMFDDELGLSDIWKV